MYEERVLAFVDVLGFTKIVENTIKNELEIEDETKKIDALFNAFHELLFKETYSSNDTSTSKIISHFSDTIVISCLKTEKSGIFCTLVNVLFLCATALQEDFLLRGVIVCGKLYHTKEKIYGPALTKAYEMEKKLALYPRVILDDNVLEIAKKYSNNQEFKTIEKIILKDFDGLFYLNYFDLTKINIFYKNKGLSTYFELLREKVKSMSEKENLSIRSKYLWLKEKLPVVLKRYKSLYYNDKTKEKFPELYDYIKGLVKIEKKEYENT